MMYFYYANALSLSSSKSYKHRRRWSVERIKGKSKKKRNIPCRTFCLVYIYSNFQPLFSIQTPNRKQALEQLLFFLFGRTNKIFSWKGIPIGYRCGRALPATEHIKIAEGKLRGDVTRDSRGSITLLQERNYPSKLSTPDKLYCDPTPSPIHIRPCHVRAPVNQSTDARWSFNEP